MSVGFVYLTDFTSSKFSYVLITGTQDQEMADAGHRQVFL